MEGRGARRCYWLRDEDKIAETDDGDRGLFCYSAWQGRKMRRGGSGVGGGQGVGASPHVSHV